MLRRSLALLLLLGAGLALENQRPPPAQRLFTSAAVDRAVEQVAAGISDPELSVLFQNCLPNTLDTTVLHFTPAQGQAKDDSFVITGDIPASWLRDSLNQVLPYMRWAKEDAHLRAMLRGVVNRQVRSVLLDPWANAFNYDLSSNPGPNQADATSKPGFLDTRSDAMTPLVFERKYELDSVVSLLKLSAEYVAATDDWSPFDADWVRAVTAVADTVESMQTSTLEALASPPYEFQRAALNPTDSLLHSVGFPAGVTGMSRTCFRPSDDASVFPFLVPANAMAVVELRRAAAILEKISEAPLAARLTSLAAQIDEGIQTFGIVNHPTFGEVYAYEVDGFGNAIFMDDANVPSLLSLPYLGYLDASDPVYQRTRALVLSEANPWFFRGTAGSGIGGPHVGEGSIWPMSIIMRALTSEDPEEIDECLDQLIATSAGTGFIHESFWMDDASTFSRPWFAWANALFGELVMRLQEGGHFLPSQGV